MWEKNLFLEFNSKKSLIQLSLQNFLLRWMIKNFYFSENFYKIPHKFHRRKISSWTIPEINLTNFLSFSSSFSEPLSSEEQSSEELMMSGSNKRTFSTSSNSSVLSSSYCVTLGVGPLWCSWCNNKRENRSR